MTTKLDFVVEYASSESQTNPAAHLTNWNNSNGWKSAVRNIFWDFFWVDELGQIRPIFSNSYVVQCGSKNLPKILG